MKGVGEEGVLGHVKREDREGREVREWGGEACASMMPMTETSGDDAAEE